MLLFLYLFMTFQPTDDLFEADVKRIEQISTFTPRHVTLQSPNVEDNDAIKRLLKHATKAQLLSILDHQSTMVRAYANYIFFIRFPDEWFPIGIDKLHEKETVKTAGVNISSPSRLSALYFSWLRRRVNTLKSEAANAKDPRLDHFADEIHLNLVRAVFALDRPNWPIFEVFFRESDLPEDLYPHVRMLAQTQTFALPSLARYQKAQDVPLILEFLKAKFSPFNDYRNIFKAATILPDPSYADALDQAHQEMLQNDDYPSKSETKNLYSALIVNQHPNLANIMLTTIYANKKGIPYENHILGLQEALAIHELPQLALHQEFLFENWYRNGYLRNHYFDFLWQSNPGRCLQTIRAIATGQTPWKAVPEPGELYSESRRYYHFSVTHITSTILASHGTKYIETLHQMIACVSNLEIPFFLPLLLEHQLSTTLPYLIQRLEVAEDWKIIKWLIIGIRHLEPIQYKDIVNGVINKYPAWELEHPSFFGSKAENVRDRLYHVSTLERELELRGRQPQTRPFGARIIKSWQSP